ncbi:aminopeptidase P family protein [Streptomyces sp. NPDC057271]|uniref:aminopeptidase P family protein n=1 Tax=unclassified Streptomyces TaxID=2593676 RepID=UPI0036413F31
MDPTEDLRSHDPRLPEALRSFMREGWVRDETLAPSPSGQVVADHARRRDRLSHAFPGETLVVPTGGEKVRSNSTCYPFRPGSDFAWLTGEYDPDSVLVMHPTAGGHRSVLYTRPPSSRATDAFYRDAQYGELWVGSRPTLAEKAAALGIDTADLADLDVLRGLRSSRTRVLRGVSSYVDGMVPKSDNSGRDRELAALLSEFRLVKDDWEIAQLQDAADATVRGFEDVARALPSDRCVSERLIDGLFWARARHDGNDVGYLSIVAAGAHAATLHWGRNDGVVRPGDLLLMDMGVENRHFYTADVTRTVPVSGKYTPLQRELYGIVHTSQQAGIQAIRPGVAFEDVHQTCMRVLAEGLEALGILPVSADEALDKNSMLYWRWTLASFGHMLGIDVHDCAQARIEKYRGGALEEGFVLTVEPGLYFQPDDAFVPEELRGIGIRIEDDVLVTAEGPQVLTSALPNGADEVETWLANQREAGPRQPS